jgi:hypothetical protein
MDGWIARRIRATSLRRVVVWTLALVGFVVVATSDRRYIANFLSGPYPLAQADLDSIRDVTSTPRYSARVTAERVIDTGIRQYTVHKQRRGDEPRRVGGVQRVRPRQSLPRRETGADEPSVAEGKLVPWTSDLEAQLFDTKDMLSLRSKFYPVYLDSESFRRPGFVVIGVGIVLLLLFVWQAIPAWRTWRNPERHPLWTRVAQWGDPLGIALEAEHEYENSLMRGKVGWRVGNKFLVRSTFFTFNVLRFYDVPWGYKKITRHSVNVIPTGKTYEAIVACYGGTATIPGKEQKVNELLTFVQQRAPWAIYGYSDQLAATFNTHRKDVAGSVEQRRKEWVQKAGSV